MKKTILKILKEDFDWITDIPSFIEITEPVTQNNPKDVFRLYWTNEHYTGDYDVWENDWTTFPNDSNGIQRLTRYLKMLDVGVNRGIISTRELTKLYFSGNHDYIATDWMVSQLSKNGLTEEEKIEQLSDMLSDDLSDMGFYRGDSTLEKWYVTYFDENGIEFNTKINKI